MASGSTSKSSEKVVERAGRQRLEQWQPKIEPFVPNNDHNPRDLKSWAKRTGFNFSGETEVRETNGAQGVVSENVRTLAQRNGSSPKIEIDPILGRSKGNDESEIGPASINGNGVGREGKRNDNGRNVGAEPVNDDKKLGLNGHGKEVAAVAPVPEPKDTSKNERDVEIDMFSEPDPEHLVLRRRSRLKCGLTENPGPVPLVLYGVQHYLSLAGSLIFIPLIIVPAMGGSDEETATVISTMLLVSGLTTLLHSYFGTRLPLVQGSSFMYLAPALVIINSEDYRNLTENIYKSGGGCLYCCCNGFSFLQLWFPSGRLLC